MVCSVIFEFIASSSAIADKRWIRAGRAGTGGVGCGNGISGDMGACASFRVSCPLLNYSYLHLIDTR